MGSSWPRSCSRAPELGIDMTPGLDFPQDQNHLVRRAVLREWILYSHGRAVSGGGELGSGSVDGGTGRQTYLCMSANLPLLGGRSQENHRTFLWAQRIAHQDFEVPIGNRAGNTEIAGVLLQLWLRCRPPVNLAPCFKIADSFRNRLIITAARDLVPEAKKQSPPAHMISMYHEKRYPTSLYGYREDIPTTLAHRITEERAGVKAVGLGSTKHPLPRARAYGHAGEAHLAGLRRRLQFLGLPLHQQE